MCLINKFFFDLPFANKIATLFEHKSIYNNMKYFAK